MRIYMVVVALLLGASASSQTFIMNDETTDVTFSAKHMAAALEGTFKGVDGKVFFDPKRLDNSYIKFSFSASKVTTNESFFTPNLIRSECFNASKYPNIELSSTSITPVNDSTFNFNGTLRIKGIAKPTSFRFTAKPNAGGYDFKFGFPINKKRYGLSCLGLSNLVKIKVRAYAKLM